MAGGEGVFGLQRAFHMAGAHSVIASLWKVDDQVTQELMKRFYHNLWQKKMGKLEALRQAQLSILKEANSGLGDRGPGNKQRIRTKSGRAHPRLWAAWVLSGDPGLSSHRETQGR